MKIEAQQITKKYGARTIIRDFSAQWSSGIYGIAGPNGSGKSTLLRCLTYLVRPSRGSIRWSSDGQELQQSEVRTRLGYVAPYIECYPELSGRENIQFLADARSRKLSAGDLDRLFDRLGIIARADQPYQSLSTGQRQRIKLATALFHNPDVLVMDEPGSNLDQKGRDLVASVIMDYRASRRLVLLASNQPQELSWCDDVITLETE
ncbi:MAG: ABC transporter ATP-binding protein [Bacteroidota bacterium]